MLKFIDKLEKNKEKVRPEFLTSLANKAWNVQEIKDIIEESQIRFGQVPWQLLCCGANRAASFSIEDPAFASSLLLRIPQDKLHLMFEAVPRRILSCASHLNDLQSAKIAFDLIPSEKRTPLDVARLINAGIEVQRGYEIIQEAISVPPEDVGFQTFGSFLKFCNKFHNGELGKKVWKWGESIRNTSTDRGGLVATTILAILLHGRTGDISLSHDLWREIVSLGISKETEILGAMLTVLAAHGNIEETKKMFSTISLDRVDPQMLTSVLNAYSHCGLAEEAWKFFQNIKEELDKSGGDSIDIQNYNTVVDAFARKGEFKKAFQVVETAEQSGLKLDSVIWMTILGPCRQYAEIEPAKQAFSKLQEMEDITQERLAAAYVVMADIYRICGDNDSCERMHKERLERGLVKLRGAVTTTVKGITYTFHVDDIPVELGEHTDQINTKLDEWTIWLSSRGVSTESIQCRHSEKLALAFAVCENEKEITLRKNLRICAACHEASMQITLLEGIKIFHWDRNRVHTMEDGKCSCGGYF
eukprot:TRINITY_DN2470_c0_g1_i1.p1 TRINITY_DN2470_c0_g1~~TRINITY_DN2470_c0_g1_i1.p1  ORF type:complete len:531 (+),score=78.37 TRINITY_DN2470_c0_g1_i1:416-2008(+)